MEKGPTLAIRKLSAAAKRALVISTNKVSEQAVWDFDQPKDELRELADLDFDVELTRFTTGEVDILLDGAPPETDVKDSDYRLDDDAPLEPQISVADD